MTLSTTAGSLGSVTDNGNGTYTAVLTAPTTAGTANITGTIAGAAIGNPTSVTFTVPLSAANTHDHRQPDLDRCQWGQHFDDHRTGEGCEQQQYDFVQRDSDVEPSPLGSLGSVTDNGNGTYTAILTAPITAGTANITGTIGGTAIGHTASVTLTSPLTPGEIALYDLNSATPLAPTGVAAGVTAGNVVLGYSWFWSEVAGGLQITRAPTRQQPWPPHPCRPGLLRLIHAYFDIPHGLEQPDIQCRVWPGACPPALTYNQRWTDLPPI